jgi:ring-1,2-phenylacetyl-CoA epoxidase subunit PaaD
MVATAAIEQVRSSRAKSRGAGTETERRPSTTLGTNEVVERIWSVLAGVQDPEIPVISLVDLGIVRGVSPDRVTITPTYTGCPATLVIEQDIRAALNAAGFRDVAIETTLSPPWTTEWISDAGKAKLHAYGIAPPSLAPTATCPQCGSTLTEEISRFGSTPCKAQWRCRDCLEPFDRFKCH